MRFLLFGTGDYYNRYKKWFKCNDIVALLDNAEQKQYTVIDGYKVLPPEEGIKLQYDAVVILSFYVKQMKQQLISLGVNEEKIYHFYDLNQLFAGKEADLPIQYYLNAEKIVKSKRQTELKILLMSTDLTFGGPSLALFHAAVILKKQGYIVTYASMWDGVLKEKLIEQGISVIVDENLPVLTMKQTAWVSAFSLIICNTLNFHVFLSERNTAIPVIWWLHDARFFYDGVDRDIIGRISLKNVQAVAVGPVPRKAVNEFLPNLKCGELLYGVRDIETKHVKKKNGNVMRFITIGFLEDIKGHDILLNAVRILPDRIRQNCEFYIVGHNKTLFGEKMKDESKEVHEIIFTGSVERDKIHELLSTSDVLICPSRQDAMPTVVAEAMMHSVPCIISDVIGTAAYINHGKNGLIFPSENAKELADKIEWSVYHKDEMLQMGIGARYIYEKVFSMDVFERKLLEIINRDMG